MWATDTSARGSYFYARRGIHAPFGLEASATSGRCGQKPAIQAGGPLYARRGIHAPFGLEASATSGLSVVFQA